MAVDCNLLDFCKAHESTVMLKKIKGAGVRGGTQALLYKRVPANQHMKITELRNPCFALPI